ncbi:MAG: hypothetical protein CTY16_15780 [Methylobacter sp.]|nr:MAG: hypothetical protein CTY16_15780 [Methylobacter sp.]
MNGIPQTYSGKPLIHVWTYRAKDGAAFGQVGRYQDGNGKKAVVPFFKPSGSNWAMGAPDEPRPLFGLDRLANQPKEKAVFIVEGEKAAAALHGLGLCAVTSLGGANQASKADWTPLNGFNAVYLMPDNDNVGEQYAQAVYRALMALERSPAVKIIRLDGLPEGGDIVDWLQNHAPDWNGYTPFPPDSKVWAIAELKAKADTAEPVPESWRVETGNHAGFIWEAPNAITTHTPPVQALPLQIIPEPFRAWLADVSHRMQTPPDFATVSALVITSSVIGAGCAMRPKRLDDWEVTPNLWGACIGRPSVVLKSPSMKEPISLLERLQADYGEQYEQDKAAAEFEQLANDAMLDDVKAKLKKIGKGKGKDGVVDNGDLAKLRADFMELNAKAEPEAVRRLFKTNETSIQSMTKLNNENPRGLLVFRDELMGLLANWDREDKADERAYFLEGWNGNGSYTDVKIGRGLTEAPNICISLLGGIQPDKLKRYLYQALQGNNDGLMQRLQLAVWPDEPTEWALIDTVPDKAEKQRAYSIIKTLAELDFRQYGAVQGEHDDRLFFRFDDDAQAVFNEWLTELQTVKLPREENPLMVEHLGKFRSLMPSLALIFHCIDIADGKAQGAVSATAAWLAVDWCDYLESHARRIYAMAESPEHEAAIKLADKMKAKVLPNPFTAKDVYKNHWHGLKDRQEVESACHILIDENWLMMTRKPKPALGRQPLPDYHINPVFL